VSEETEETEETDGPKRPRRLDPERHADQVRRGNRARSRAARRLRERYSEDWTALLIEECAKEGVTPVEVTRAKRAQEKVRQRRLRIARLKEQVAALEAEEQGEGGGEGDS
jgi:hypothetical protein